MLDYGRSSDNNRWFTSIVGSKSKSVVQCVVYVTSRLSGTSSGGDSESSNWTKNGEGTPRREPTTK